MTETTLCFIDTETTGLDPDHHEIWEVALIKRYGEGPRIGEEDSYVWQLPVDLAEADPIALNIGRFHDRRWPQAYPDQPAESADEGLSGERVVHPDNMWLWAKEFVALTRGAHLVGNVVSFDAERLWKLLRKHGQCPMWHYHLIDVEALVAGFMQGRADPDGMRSGDAMPPWDSDRLAAAVGVKISDEDRHTALGDARWARDLYDAVMGTR